MAEETDGYSECLQTDGFRPSISDMNKAKKGDEKQRSNFPIFTKDIVQSFNSSDLAVQQNALNFRDSTNRALVTNLKGRDTNYQNPLQQFQSVASSSNN